MRRPGGHEQRVARSERVPSVAVDEVTAARNDDVQFVLLVGSLRIVPSRGVKLHEDLPPSNKVAERSKPSSGPGSFATA